jgi:cyanate permease
MRGLIACSAVGLGLVVGLPYYGMPFFYDYFARPAAEGGFGWSRGGITLGLPLGTLITLVAGPWLVPWTAPRWALAGGTVACAAAMGLMGRMSGSLWEYYALWMLYMLGWSFAGPLVHQVVLTRRITEGRGSALALASLGVSGFGALSVRALAAPVTGTYGFRAALGAMGAAVALALPFVWAMTRGVDGATGAPARKGAAGAVWKDRAFWLLLSGSTCAIAALGAVSQHLKLIFAEAGYGPQSLLDRVYGETLLVMLIVGAAGRLTFGRLADRYPKGRVLTGAFVLMALAAPLLFRLQPPGAPYLFAVIFGFGMGVDFLLTPLLAAEQFGTARMAAAMGLILPVNTIGQTWFPYVISLVREGTGSYDVPLYVIFACALAGRLLMSRLPAR